MSTSPTVRLATASLIGTTLEYYDFAVYSTLAALVFNRLFFPSFDPLSGTILALSTFAVGYVARPIGGVIFGNLGERFGRRFVLVTTLLVMGTTTAMIGLLPTYESAGILGSGSAGSASVCAGLCARRRVGWRGIALC